MIDEQQIAQAEALFQEGKIEEARQSFEELLREDPLNATVLNNLGVIAYEAGDLMLAEAYFSRAFDADSHLVETLHNLLSALLSLKRYTATVGLLRHIMTQCPAHPELREAVGNATENIAREFAAMVAQTPEASFWHDRKMTFGHVYHDRFFDASQPYRVEYQNDPIAVVLEALYRLAAEDDFWGASQLWRAVENSQRLPEWVWLFFASLWLLIDRVYEARFFASQLPADSDLAPLAQRLLVVAKNRETLPQVADAYKRILVIMEEGIGNMVMLLPALQAVRQCLPQSHLTVLGKKASIALLTGSDCADSVLTTLDESDYDLTLASVWATQIFRTQGEKIRRISTFVFSTQLQGGEHEAEANLRLARFLGYSGALPLPRVPTAAVPVELPTDKPLAVLSNTTVNNGMWERKRWPYFAEMAASLQQKGYTVVAVGGEEEARKYNRDYWGAGVIDLQGKLSLPETAGVIARASFFVGNDSGPAHLAGATGVPTFVLFGPTLASKNRPLGKEVHLLSQELPCSPCQYTERWPACQDWQCMSGMTPEWVWEQIAPHLDREQLRLPRKNYSDCHLLGRDGRLWLTDGAIAEPLTIHLVGKARTNFPWGMENEMIRAFEQMGCTVFHTDYVGDQEDFVSKFQRPAHVMLVFRGSGIPPELILNMSYLSLLWYQDDVFAAAHAPRDLAFNGRFFDLVYCFDYFALDKYHQFGIRNVAWLPLAAATEIYHKSFRPKRYDVTFVGNIYPNRRALLDRLAAKFNVHVAQAFGEEAAKIYSESKIVLNLGIGRTGIQQRVFEVLCSGAFLLTNAIPEAGRLFEDRKHLVYFNNDNIEALIAYYLEHESEREQIALAGYREAVAWHTFQQRAEAILADHFPQQSPAVAAEQPPRVESAAVRIARDRDVVPGFSAVALERLQQRFANRTLQIVAAFQHFNWENHNLQPALAKFGTVTRYDWHPEFDQYDNNWHTSGKLAMNRELFRRVQAQHATEPVDIFFSYLSGRLVFPGIIRGLRRLGIAAVNMYLDDVKGFWGNFEPTGFASMIDVAGAFDLCWTTHEPALPWYQSVGTAAINLPEGANPEVFRPLTNVARDLDVVFVGQNYGMRPQLIDRLQAQGFDVQAYGKGWPNGPVSTEEMIMLFNRARIVLGVGQAFGSEAPLQIKGRDFEVPMTGALYLTQHNPELARYFRFGAEIDTYRDEYELLEKVNFYLKNPDQAEKIRCQARSRSLRDHTWELRFQRVFQTLIDGLAES